VIIDNRTAVPASRESVINGLEADVVTLALAYDIDVISQPIEIFARRLAKAFAGQQHALHFDDVFLVRKGIENTFRLDDVVNGRFCRRANPKLPARARWLIFALRLRIGKK